MHSEIPTFFQTNQRTKKTGRITDSLVWKPRGIKWQPTDNVRIYFKVTYTIIARTFCLLPSSKG